MGLFKSFRPGGARGGGAGVPFDSYFKNCMLFIAKHGDIVSLLWYTLFRHIGLKCSNRAEVASMKQFQFAYEGDEHFQQQLAEIRGWRDANPSYATLFRIYSDDMELDHIRHVCDILDEAMPDALYMGATTHANIMNGALAEASIILSCTVFEYETTQMKLLQFPFSEENAKEVVDELRDYCEANPWVSAVEMHANMLGVSVREFCDEMTELRDDIQVYGGGAYNPRMDDEMTVVFSKGNGFSDHSIVFLLLGGPDFHTYSTLIAGWKPLTRKFRITKADRQLLYELDGEPAFNVYQKFLKISRSDNLVANTVEFPLFMDYKGVPVLRCPLGINDDDALVMATEVLEGTDVRIAYGDPETILASIRQDGQKIADFQPEVIQTFSCAARKAFWGDDNVSDETLLLSGIAPTSGFYTSGEFLRMGSEMRNFNITLVLVAMREGEPKDDAIVNLYDTRLGNIESEERIPLIRRFVSFIEATTKELEASNRELEVANRKLAYTSITDGLTGLYNRTEIERGIKSSLQMLGSGSLSLIMLDLDNFKKVNDVYGHGEGDRVIIALSDLLQSTAKDLSTAYAGRWGGEEFMMLLHDADVDQAAALAEKIRAEFAKISYDTTPCQTVSIGVTQAKPGESSDALCTRVDKALYMAKANGKNQVVTLD